MNHLALRLTYKKPSCQQEDEPNADMWGAIQLIYTDSETKELQELFYWEWYLESFAKWFIRNSDAMKYFELVSPHGCQAKKKSTMPEEFWRLRGLDYTNEEDEYVWEVYLDEFSQSHDLHNGLMGSQSPSVLIGRKGDVGEVGILQKDGSINVYQFDLNEFLRESYQEIKRFLQTCRTVINDEQKNLLDKYILAGLTKSEVLLPIDTAIEFFHRFGNLHILLDGFYLWREFELENGEVIKVHTPADLFLSNEFVNFDGKLTHNPIEIVSHLEAVQASESPVYVTFIFSDGEIQDYLKSKLKEAYRKESEK